MGVFMMYNIKVTSEDAGRHLCLENSLNLVKFYNGRGRFNKDKLMMQVELIDTSNSDYLYVFKRSDGMYIGKNSFCTPYRSQAGEFALSVREAIRKLNSLNEDNGPTWTMQKV